MKTILAETSTTYHSIHEANKAPKGNCIVLFDRINGGKEVAHALNIAQIGVVLIVSQEHVFHLLKMHIGANIREWRVRVWVWNVLALEKRNMSVCPVHIFLYMADSQQWDTSV